jgi:hypothetical protein
MREWIRRRICQSVFVACCVLPTLGTCCAVLYRISPWHAAAERAAWERVLFEHTGLLARIGRIEHPGGGSTLLAGVELDDPDGGDLVVRLRQAELVSTRQGTLVALSQPEVAQGKLLRLWDTLHERVLRGPRIAAPLQVTAGELTLEVGSRAQTFTLLRCTVEPGDAGVLALLEFQLAGLEMPSPAVLSLERNRQTLPPSTRWQLTSSTPIPCALFTDYLPGAARLGPRCSFQGQVAASSHRDHWSAELTGRFTQVDLESASEPFPHRASGQATLALRGARVENGVLQHAAGSLTCPGGTLDASLLQSFREHLNLNARVAAIDGPVTNIPYSELSFDFQLGPESIVLAGQCPGDAPGIIMTSAAGRLLAGEPGKPYPIVALIRALSPASDWLVPATAESRGLMSVVAPPSRQPRQGTIAERPRSRVRLLEPPRH